MLDQTVEKKETEVSQEEVQDLAVKAILYKRFDFFIRLYDYMNRLSIDIEGVKDQIARKVAPFTASERAFLRDSETHILQLCIDKINNYMKKHKHG